jgi:hypothetical protein
MERRAPPRPPRAMPAAGAASSPPLLPFTLHYACARCVRLARAPPTHTHPQHTRLHTRRAPRPRSLLGACEVVELSAAEDYRRLALTDAAAGALAAPLPAAAAGAGGAGAGPALSAAGVAAAGTGGAGGGAAALEGQRLYLWPLGAAAAGQLERLWLQVAGPRQGHHHSHHHHHHHQQQQQQQQHSHQQQAGPAWAAGDVVPVLFGRELLVPRSAGGAAWVSRRLPPPRRPPFGSCSAGTSQGPRRRARPRRASPPPAAQHPAPRPYPRAAPTPPTCRARQFEFSDLCARPLGSADYIALAQRYHTVFISGESPGRRSCM